MKPKDRKTKLSITIDPLLFSKLDELYPNKSKYIEQLILSDLIKTGRYN